MKKDKGVLKLSQEIEIEFKNLLTKEEFNQIRTYLSFPDKGVAQTNFYFETKDFTLKNNHAALRIREKNGEYTLTLKQPGGQGLLERSEEHTSELQSRFDLVCRLLLESKTHPNYRIRGPGEMGSCPGMGAKSAR